MPRIFWSHFFTDENMTQMRAASVAGNFSTQTIGIIGSFDSAGYFLVKTRPAAARMKFGIRIVEWCFASAAEVCAFDKKIIVFTGKWRFSALTYDDSGFFWC